MTPAVRRPRDPVLIIEDNSDVQEVLAFMLERDGFNVVGVENGSDALAALIGGLKPCLILLDYHMPIMDGPTFRRQQLARGIQPEVPVVLYSADPSISVEDMHVHAVIRKPIEFDRLVPIVEDACLAR